MKLEEEEESGDEEENKKEKPKVYRPPKLAAVHYGKSAKKNIIEHSYFFSLLASFTCCLILIHVDGDLSEKERTEMKLEKAKKRALSSSIMKDLRDEYYEGPEEIRVGCNQTYIFRKFEFHMLHDCSSTKCRWFTAFTDVVRKQNHCL